MASHDALLRDMQWIPGGTFRMGSQDHYPEERPVHDVAVDGFWIDDHQVTVGEFRRFVKATGHVSVAERPLEPADYPDADPDLFTRLPRHARSGRLERLPELVALDARRSLGPPRRSGQRRGDAGPTSGDPRRL